MGFQRIVRGQLFRHLARKRGRQAALHVDLGQLQQLALRRIPQLACLHREIGCLGIGLRLHGDVFACSHRHGARHRAGHAGQQDRRRRCATRGHAYHQAGDRHDAVVDAQHRGAQPAHAIGAMTFAMAGLGRAGMRGHGRSVVHVRTRVDVHQGWDAAAPGWPCWRAPGHVIVPALRPRGFVSTSWPLPSREPALVQPQPRCRHADHRSRAVGRIHRLG